MQRGKVWTEEETTYLKKASQEGVSLDKIADKLGRTKSAVNNRRSILGIRGKDPRAWSDEDANKAVKLRRQGVDIKEIAKKLGRTVDATRQRTNMVMRQNTFSDEVKSTNKGTINKNPSKAGLNTEIETLKKGQNYLLKTRGTGILSRQEVSKEIATYKGNTDDLLIFKRKNYIETYTKVDVALGEVSIREATKTDYQTIQ